MLDYLATPYSLYPRGTDAAYREASRIAAGLLKRGHKVFSPIAHSHSLAKYGAIDPVSHDIWLPYDIAIMDVCHRIIVATMPGWENSEGVAFEMKYFRSADKPVRYVSPGSLVVTATPLDVYHVPDQLEIEEAIAQSRQ